jgi:SRSO17 transposase
MLGEEDGILIVDGSATPKKGKHSVGVGRQYCGKLGKVENCQLGVFVAYLGKGATAFLDARLFVPQAWVTPEHEELRERCRMPKDLTFQTEASIAREMIREVAQRGQVPFRWVLADEGYGRSPVFLDGIPEGVSYFCEVPRTTGIWLSDPAASSGAEEPSAEVKPVPVEQLIAGGEIAWTPAVLREGSKGPIKADVARLRVWDVRHNNNRPVAGKLVWLFLRRDLETGDVKYFLSSAPESTPMEKMAELSARRCHVETLFEDAKTDLGMDDYELRGWTGWAHHMTLVMLAQFFALSLQRDVKKKRPTSPSP